MIKLFTHNDLDGLSCVLLAQLAFGIDHVDYETCRYEDINDKVIKYIDDKFYLEDSHCFITDISVSYELAREIDRLIQPKFSLLDHHVSALSLNEYPWCHVAVTTDNDVKTCGTSLFFEALKQSNVPHMSTLLTPAVEEFVEKVRRYDTWDWQALEDTSSKKLNDLFYILGKERFLTYWYQRLLTDSQSFSFDPSHELLLELKQNEINKYIESRNEDLILDEIAGYKAGIVFATQFQSELGNALALLHPELDFIAMINVGGGVSFRTAKENVNLSEIASLFGGGGHAKAAGLPVGDHVRQLVIDTLFHSKDNGES